MMPIWFYLRGSRHAVVETIEVYSCHDRRGAYRETSITVLGLAAADAITDATADASAVTWYVPYTEPPKTAIAAQV